jgi:predicted RNA-binding protein with PUA-like domain
LLTGILFLRQMRPLWTEKGGRNQYYSPRSGAKACEWREAGVVAISAALDQCVEVDWVRTCAEVIKQALFSSRFSRLLAAGWRRLLAEISVALL